MASKDKTNYDALKSDLEEVIKSKVKDEDVELDDDFFAMVEYKVTRLTGVAGLTAEDEQKLISEDETRFENVSEDVRGQNFTFTSSYQENSTLSLVASSGWSVGIGSKLGGGAMGATGEVNATGSYSRSKTKTSASEHGETKTLQFSGRVGAGSVVSVKELTYNITRKRDCDIELIVAKKSEIPYFKNEEEKKIELTKSLMNKLAEKKGIKKMGNNLAISLSGPFEFKKVMRNLRVQQVELEGKRKKRIAPQDVDPFGTDDL